MKLTFVTTNDRKLINTQAIVAGAGIELIQAKVETPEIQAQELKPIAEYSAEWAARELKKTVLVNDFGYFISSLNGFPGAFSKQIISWLTADGLLNLMAPYSDRSIEIRRCFALGYPDKPPQSITLVNYGLIADSKGREGQNSMHQILIPTGFDRPYSEFTATDSKRYWQENFDGSALINFLNQYA